MSMDSFAIKVDNSVKFGDKVYIFKDINHALTCIEDKTDLANIIAILCCLTKRIPRVPVKEFK
jgi:alanine racemase